MASIGPPSSACDPPIPHRTKDGSYGSLACFVSPHGFGHAARTAAVLEATARILPGIELDLYTTVPTWFFDRSLSARYRYHRLESDVGLVQKSSLEEDPEATLSALDSLFPPPPDQLDDLALALTASDCRLVLADISPLGLAAAAKAGIPSVLLENFTWDWIYRHYLDQTPGLSRHLSWLATTSEGADLHIQARPCCRPAATALSVPPVSRSPRRSREEIRRELGVGDEERLVLVTMGGVAWSYPEELATAADRGVVYVVPGGSERRERRGNLILLPHHSDFYHPDLVAAADRLVGKLGYSTLAEAYWAGVEFLYVPRPRFAESAILESFVRRHLPAAALSHADFAAGRWSAPIDTAPPGAGWPREEINGADLVAARLSRWFVQQTR